MKLTTVKMVGVVPWGDLDEETKADVIVGIREVTGDYNYGLENGTLLPLVKVPPLEISDPNQRMREGLAETYADKMKGGVQFPPVIIDSSKGQVAALIEGRHRTEAAILAMKKWILAIDLSGIRIAQKHGEQFYMFPR